MTTPTTKPALKQLILDALAADYTSKSSHEGIPTGNRYQSVRLGDELTKGFRGSRDDVLAGVRFQGQTVLDLGCNLGELSRYARSRGARLVDGIEYDKSFVEIANAINAYNDTTRVSFRQGDITNPATFDEPHDIVLAFSVYTYLRNVLPQLAAVTQKLLVLETHKVSGNLERDYLEPLGKYFPAHRRLGSTDWGQAEKHADGERLVIAFARDEATLEQLVGPYTQGEEERQLHACRALRAQDKAIEVLDLRRSELPQFEAFRKSVHDFPVRDWREFEAAITPMKLEYTSPPPDSLYWAAFLGGYFEFQRGLPAQRTSFMRYMRQYFEDTRFDPGLEKIVTNDGLLSERLQLRYLALATMRSKDPGAVVPLRGIAANPPETPVRMKLFSCDREELVPCSAIDGYHRVFSALLCGVRYLPIRFE